MRSPTSPADTETKTHKNSKSKTPQKDKKMKIHTRENTMNHTSTLIKKLISWSFLRFSSILLAIALLGLAPAPFAQARQSVIANH